MAIDDVLRAVTELLSTCSRRVSHAAQRLRGARRMKLLTMSKPTFPFVGDGRRRRKVGEETLGKTREETELDEEEVWRRGIIMGEKCQPLDFSGAIYYDAEGRQLAGAPVARSLMRSPMPACLADHDKAW